MTVTYDLASDDPAVLLISKLRFELGDTVLNKGVKPDASNYSDEELQLKLDEAADDVARATAAILTNLSVLWAQVADITVGPRKESLSQIGDRYAKRAAELGRQSGATTGTAFSVGFKRNDGYANYESTNEY
jgi:hypothetical protein